MKPNEELNDIQSACLHAAIAAQGDFDIAWVELRDGMGMPDLRESELKQMEAHVLPQRALEEELANAPKMRSALKALEEAKTAAI